jgi:hypothetical protein
MTIDNKRLSNTLCLLFELQKQFITEFSPFRSTKYVEFRATVAKLGGVVDLNT